MPQESTTSFEPEQSASQSGRVKRGATFDRKLMEHLSTLVATYNNLNRLAKRYNHTVQDSEAMDLMRRGMKGLVLSTMQRANAELMNLYAENSQTDKEVVCLKWIDEGLEGLAASAYEVSIPNEGLEGLAASADEVSIPKGTGKPFGLTSAALGLPEDWKEKLVKVTYEEAMRSLKVKVCTGDLQSTFRLSVIRNRPFILKAHPNILQVCRLSTDDQFKYFSQRTSSWVDFLSDEGIHIGEDQLLEIKALHVLGDEIKQEV